MSAILDFVKPENSIWWSWCATPFQIGVQKIIQNGETVCEIWSIMCEIKDGRRSAILKFKLACFCKFSQTCLGKEICVLTSDIFMNNFSGNLKFEVVFKFPKNIIIIFEKVYWSLLLLLLYNNVRVVQRQMSPWRTFLSISLSLFIRIKWWKCQNDRGRTENAFSQ